METMARIDYLGAITSRVARRKASEHAAYRSMGMDYVKVLFSKKLS